MQNLWIPQGTCNAIDATSRRLIWGNATSHWVKWDTITQSRKNGGLGVRRARDTNVALLGKKVWSMIHDHHSLRVNLLESKYLRHDSVLRQKDYTNCSYIWASIKKVSSILSSGFRIRVGQGNVSIWYDR
ncbi:hypothetical protein JHK82_024576 [Glycine max]|nr:hypothetical protein JHK87_024544 [Glycine soja]KAG5006636.1 hypothetical protein JHK85_025178 [Glycine max]KAG5012421.1 hypothetical protein JHK86_024682 [Glycine max]KAG5133388.1 hypothetical protein JHK82_024576 [Glycine max]